jgi:7-keto-8-aminopelargonate synthetase-like enzyme
MATRLLRDIPVQRVRHSRLDLAERALEELSARHERVWLLLDGVYSMFGDCAPFQGLTQLLARWPRLHLYIDDAHATGWYGQHGRGAALTHFASHERVLVALSLNKSFAAAGGALAVPDTETKLRIRRCGGPMLFSGPIQPPMLGAAVASTWLHLRQEHALTQARLLQRIDYTRTCAERAGLTLAVQHRTPIFFIPCDCVDEATDRVRALMQAGFYVCPSGFPAVPVNRPGVRFTITLHNELADIDALVVAAAALAGARSPAAAGGIPLTGPGAPLRAAQGERG